MGLTDEVGSALRREYRKHLLMDLGTPLPFILLAVLFIRFTVGDVPSDGWIVGGVAVGAAVLAVVEYIVERWLSRKGKLGIVLYLFFVVIGSCLLAILSAVLFPDRNLLLHFPYFLTFVPIRSLIPVFFLLRDYERLKEGAFCETVGRVQEGARVEDAAVGRIAYRRFEDELTHEVHLLRVGILVPDRRYRVFFLPHSGLAVAEELTEEAERDPFGHVHSTEDAFAAQESPQERPQESGERREESPRRDGVATGDRQRAVRYGRAAVICRYGSVAGLVIAVIASLGAEGDLLPFFLIVPSVVCGLLSGYFKKRELRMICTVRVTAVCVDTVRRHRGKHSHIFPIVEYEVGGRTYTTELEIDCTRNSEGETYTIYYDPQDPQTVRVE